ncbi:hypothetical protein CDIK_2091 [Cucumispora dikerogammari]|nr:hypothetical protein CDIK_2091 [Cucumispora dikerogammari]
MDKFFFFFFLIIVCFFVIYSIKRGCGWVLLLIAVMGNNKWEGADETYLFIDKFPTDNLLSVAATEAYKSTPFLISALADIRKGGALSAEGETILFIFIDKFSNGGLI